MPNYTPQQLADQLNSLHAKAVNIVEGTIAGAALPGGSISFTYRNPIDGQIYSATGTAWNVCSPSRVSALKLPDGSWIVIGAHEAETVRTVVHVDRRARATEKKYGKVKTLHSRIEGEERVFYLWGDRVRPKRIFAITKDSYILAAKIDNLGDGDRWIVGLGWESTTESLLYQYGVYHPVTRSQVFSSNGQTWDDSGELWHQKYTDRGGDYGDVTPGYLGYGFWQYLDYGRSAPPGDAYPLRQPTTYTFYKGEIKTFPGSLAVSFATSDYDGSQYVTAANRTMSVPVSLTQMRTSTDNFITLLGGSAVEFSGELIFSSLFGKDTGYYEFYEGKYGFRQHKLVTAGSDADELFLSTYELDTSFPFAMSYANDLAYGNARGGSGHLIGNRYFQVRSSLVSNALYNTSRQWEFTQHTIGNPTPKIFNTNVQCRLDPNDNNTRILSASYHP